MTPKTRAAKRGGLVHKNPQNMMKVQTFKVVGGGAVGQTETNKLTVGFQIIRLNSGPIKNDWVNSLLVMHHHCSTLNCSFKILSFSPSPPICILVPTSPHIIRTNENEHAGATQVNCQKVGSHWSVGAAPYSLCAFPPGGGPRVPACRSASSWLAHRAMPPAGWTAAACRSAGDPSGGRGRPGGRL